MIRKKQQKVNRKQIILAPKKKWEVKAHYLQESQRQIKGLEATTVAWSKEWIFITAANDTQFPLCNL